MVAVAHTQLRRILRLIQSIDRTEEELMREETLQCMRPSDLIKAYALQQSNLMQSLDYVKRIVDMRVELQQATAAITASLSPTDVQEITTLSGLPKLDSQQRNTIRVLVDEMIAHVEADEKAIEYQMTKGFLPNGKSNGDRDK
jgi:hypothetical protein